MTSVAPVPAPLGVIGQYNLLERLDSAGPGDLFRARDTRHGRTVAVRLLPHALAPDAAARAAVLATAQGLIALSHPNIITLFGAGEHEERVFLAFEFLKGQSLRAEMGGQPMNVRRAIETAIQMANAVSDAHAAGFLHRGLSPESVVITEKGHSKIPAFELATREGFEQVDGQLRLRDYEAPEEARGQAPDDRSDVYSVGAVLYEMLTARRPPHRGASAPGSWNRHVPPELDAIVLKAVAPNPDSRYQSAATLAADLRGVLTLLDARGGASDEIVPDAARPRSGLRVALAVIALFVVALAIWIVTRI